MYNPSVKSCQPTNENITRGDKNFDHELINGSIESLPLEEELRPLPPPAALQFMKDCNHIIPELSNSFNH